MRLVLRRWRQPAGPGQPADSPGQQGESSLPSSDVSRPEETGAEETGAAAAQTAGGEPEGTATEGAATEGAFSGFNGATKPWDPVDPDSGADSGADSVTAEFSWFDPGADEGGEDSGSAEVSSAEVSSSEVSSSEVSSSEVSSAGVGEAGTEAEPEAEAEAETAVLAEPADGGETAVLAEPAVPAVVGEDGKTAGRRRRPRRVWLFTSRLRRNARAVADLVNSSGLTFTRLTLLPAMLVIAWLVPAIPLLLARSFELAPMLVISIPLALVLIVVCLRRVPSRWPMSAQAKPGPGSPAPLWSLLATVVVAAGFVAWQIVMRSEQFIVTRDPGVYLQFGYWIAQHGTTSIPASASAFGGAHPGLSFASLGFTQHGSHLSPQFLAGLPSVLAAGFWAGGTGGALVVPCVLGGFAVLTFGGLVGRLASPRWAPAGALVLALALPEQYTSRSAFGETLVQVLLFGGLCLLIDSLSIPPLPAAGPLAPRRWWRRRLATPPSPVAILAILGGLALGLTSVVLVEGLSIALPAVLLLAVMFVGRRRQWLPLSLGLLVGVGYGLAEGYLLARPYMDSLSSWLGPFGIIAGAVIVIMLDAALVWRYARLGGLTKRVLAIWPLRWLPGALAAVTVLVVAGFAVRPYVQTVRGGFNSGTVAYVGYLQRVAGLPLDPRRTYAEDTLYWVIWYIGVPALLLGTFGLALLARRVLRALITWKDPTGTARLWALPLLIIGWVTVTVLWKPGTVPDQPWASRRLVPVVLPGLILAAVWAAAWLNGRATERGAGRVLSSAVGVLCVGALLLPTTLTTFGIGVASTGEPPKTETSKGGLALQQNGNGETSAVRRLCSAIGPGASVVIVDPRVADEFTQLVRGTCDVPVAQMDRPSLGQVTPVLTGITSAHRRPVLLAADAAELNGYGTASREVLHLVTTQDAHVLTRPPTKTWPATYTIWMSQPG